MTTYVYSPDKILPGRIQEAERILKTIPAKHAFITGSFLYRKDYGDIDLFVVTRSKKEFKTDDKRIDLHVIHPNRVSSLFYHSAIKLCVSKSLLPKQRLRTTLSDYFDLLNWRLTPVDNVGDQDKEFRDAVLATVYLKEGRILDSEELKAFHFPTHESFEAFILEQAPEAIRKRTKASYRRRYYAGYKTYYAEAQPSILRLIERIIAS